ncbi:MAG: AbrB/MazE/SpoVT family DNA-binding domain-containing protein [Clostridia bacterium]|nr:AbrB/MazE/SpoVT family DNA-binding domain-containing protein [Clostridia bacterium]
MKSTGIVRQLDEVGRIVLPIEIRKSFDLNPHDPVEIFVDDEKILLKKYAPACLFCNSADDVIFFHGKLVCKECIDAMNRAAHH